MKRANLIFVIMMATIGLVFVLLVGCSQKGWVNSCSGQPASDVAQEKQPVKESCSVPPNNEIVQEAKTTPLVTEKREAEPVSESVPKIETVSELKDIHFNYDKYDLRPEDRKILTAHAHWLMKNSKYTVRIEGNCDERGTEEYNMALGQRRADEAKKYLITRGVSKKRISTISYGKDRPLDPAHNEDAWAKNRRDAFMLSSGS